MKRGGRQGERERIKGSELDRKRLYNRDGISEKRKRTQFRVYAALLFE